MTLPDAIVLLLAMPDDQREQVLDLAEASNVSHLLTDTPEEGHDS